MSLGFPGKRANRIIAQIRANAIHATEGGGVNIDELSKDGTFLSVQPIGGGGASGAEVTFNDSYTPELINVIFITPWSAL